VVLTDPITETAVRDALAAVRYARRLRSPLTSLRLVEQRLRAEGVVATPENERWVLESILHETVLKELARHRAADGASQGTEPGAAGTPPSAAVPAADEIQALLATDFRAGNREREAWSTLYARFLCPTGPRMADLPALVGASRATIARRLQTGIARLADDLRRREAAARREVAARPRADVIDRIVGAGSEPAPTGTVAEARERLLAAVRHESAEARLSAADLAALAAAPVADLESYRLARIAAWSQPRYRLDDRFVDLALLCDVADDAPVHGSPPTARRYGGLGEILAELPDSALALLGPPGAGKSTLLGRLELDVAIDGLRGVHDVVTFFVPMNMYRPGRPGGGLASPRRWLEEQWAWRYPALPGFGELLARGRFWLLLDALNEIPHAGPADYRAHVLLWKQLLQTIAAGGGNRVIVSCRSLEYSTPLSTPELRVPQVRIEPLTDGRIERFLRSYCPEQAAAVWRGLKGTQRLELLRTPFFLRLYLEHAVACHGHAVDRATLFTSFVRQALRREVRRDNPLFLPSSVLTERDYDRLVRARRWRSAYELPERGSLVPALSELAFRMQRGEPLGEAAQARLDYDQALRLLGTADAEHTLRAGVALGVLDEDTDRDQVLFSHQLLQEYFAGRRLAVDPEPELVRAEWRADRQVPPIAAVLDGLGPAEPLPPLARTNWEETTLLAAEMAPDRSAFVRALTVTNLALAGRAAAQERVRDSLPAGLLEGLRAALARRSRDAAADLRARIEAASALGAVGDPRYVSRDDPTGRCLQPPVVAFAAGAYRIGSNTPYEAIGRLFHDHMPAHEARLSAFGLAVYPVTNAEYRCFVAAGGYDDARWWATPAAAAWRRGEGTARGERLRYRYWTRVFQDRPEMLEELRRLGRMDDDAVTRWRRWAALGNAELDVELLAEFPDARYCEPSLWRDPAYNAPAQPVVGVSWYEARAYCAWLSDRSGTRYRLPSEAEWEAAARAPDGRRFPHGDESDPLKANELRTHLQRPAPVGVFPAGDTPAGLADMIGNVAEWTMSRWGSDPELPEFGYPYAADDGRESAESGPEDRRVLRGGAFYHADEDATIRSRHHPTARDAGIGFRLAVG